MTIALIYIDLEAIETDLAEMPRLTALIAEANGGEPYEPSDEPVTESDAVAGPGGLEIVAVEEGGGDLLPGSRLGHERRELVLLDHLAHLADRDTELLSLVDASDCALVRIAAPRELCVERVSQRTAGGNFKGTDPGQFYDYWHGRHAVSDALWRIYAFTDRPAYRPGETVQWKMTARIRQNEEWVTPSNAELDYVITNPRGEKMVQGSARLNAFVSFWSEVPLTDAMPLGVYNIAFHAKGNEREARGGAQLFRLEEYKLPEFVVTVSGCSLGEAEVVPLEHVEYAFLATGAHELPPALEGVRILHITDLHLRTRWPRH